MGNFNIDDYEKLWNRIRKERILSKIHRVGIIPVSGGDNNLYLPFHDSLCSIGQDFLAIERSVLECSEVGCQSIWIICPSSIEPLIRSRVGEAVEDALTKKRSEYQKSHTTVPNWLVKDTIYQIPIYYVRMPIVENLNYSRAIFECAKKACQVSESFSKYIVPSHFYVSFPMTVFYSPILSNIAGELSNYNRFFVRNNGKTMKDGNHYSFQFSIWDYWKIRRHLLNAETTNLSNPDSKHFSIEKIFSHLKQDEKSLFYDVEWIYEIKDWETYCEYMESGKPRHTRKSKRLFYREFLPWGDK